MIVGDGEELPSYEELVMRMELSGAVPIQKRTYDAIFREDGLLIVKAQRWFSAGMSSGKFRRFLGEHRSYIEDFVGFCLVNHLRVSEHVLEGIESLSIPEGVEFIGYAAFCGYRGLTNVTIPDTVTSIGYGAFYGCGGLTVVTIPDSVKSIGDWAFEGCSGLTTVAIGSGVECIGEFAFHGCENLRRVAVNAENMYRVKKLYDWGGDVLFEMQCEGKRRETGIGAKA